jgi:uncharacterized protein
MAQAAEKAGIGPMSTVAGLFAREAGNEIIQNFSVEELVIENGGDIFALLKKNSFFPFLQEIRLYQRESD